MQAIYSGKTQRSHPSPNSPHYQNLIEAGFLIEESGTKNYWSNQKTMESFVNKILAPYFDKAKVKLGLLASQRCLWKIVLDGDTTSHPNMVRIPESLT